MTENSWPWTCTATGDGGAASFSLDVVRVTNAMLTNADQTGAGVIYWKDTTILPFTSFAAASDGELAISNPAGDTIRVASGVGLVQGWLYASDGNTDFDVSGGNATATDIIVLRRDVAAQTVRLALKRGAAATKAVVTQTAATWEIALAEVLLTAGGAFSALTDVREVVRPPVGSMALLETIDGPGSAAITFSGITPLYKHLHIIGIVAGSTASVTVAMNIIFNADTGANYQSIQTLAINSTQTTTQAVAQDNIVIGSVTGSTGAANSRDTIMIDIPYYSDTGKGDRSCVFTTTARGDGTGGAAGVSHTAGGGWWDDASEIATITISLTPSGGFTANSKVSLYGIAG